MAKHALTIEVPALEVGKVDVVFMVRRDGDSHGRLKISRGGVEWMPKSNSKSAFHMTWDRFDRVMEEQGPKGSTRSGKWRAAAKSASG